MKINLSRAQFQILCLGANPHLMLIKNIRFWLLRMLTTRVHLKLVPATSIKYRIPNESTHWNENLSPPGWPIYSGIVDPKWLTLFQHLDLYRPGVVLLSADSSNTATMEYVIRYSKHSPLLKGSVYSYIISSFLFSIYFSWILEMFNPFNLITSCRVIKFIDLDNHYSL